MELQEFPYQDEQRPFDWFLQEDKVDIQAKETFDSPKQVDQINDLVLCMFLYQLRRKQMYINYMRGAKHLFAIFFPAGKLLHLKEKNPHWNKDYTDYCKFRGLGDWSPAYEIQRLWLATNIHWQWLEWAWYVAEDMIWHAHESWRIKNLERIPYV